MNVQAYLTNQNPWWSASFKPETMPEFSQPKRFAYAEGLEILTKTKLMLFIKGLRRLGKTTLMKQMILDLLVKNHVSPQQIFFVEFSHAFNDLAEIFKIAPKNGYLFLDEIQYCRDWRDALKIFYDNNKQVRVVFSGSAALSYTGEKESMMGRFLPLTLTPLRFDEFLFLKHGDFSSVHFRNEEEWEEFLRFGEFPELLKLPSMSAKQNYINNSIIEPLLTVDVDFYQVEKKKEFGALLQALAQNVGQMINRQKLGAELGISRPLVYKYLRVLEDIQLIKLVGNYHKSVRQVTLSDKKVYFSSVNLIFSLLGNFLFADFMGHLFENAIYNELLLNFPEMFYFRRKAQELDFFGIKNGVFQGFEVKKSKTVSGVSVRRYEKMAKLAGASKFSLIYEGKTKMQDKLINYLNLNL